MAEDTEELLEESAEGENKSKGLSTSLLIKIAIGLGIVLIALVVAFFMMPDPAPVEEEQAQLESPAAPDADVNAESETGSEDMADTDTDGIELPAVDETAVTSTDNESVSSSQPDLAAPAAKPNQMASEIMALQKQISGLQQDNQKLIKQVEQLVKENKKLTTQVSQLTAQRPSLDEVIADERLVSSYDSAAEFRQQRYRHTPQPELAPKWGEFETLKPAQ